MNRVDGSEKERKATKEQSGKVRKPGRNGGEGKGEGGRRRVSEGERETRRDSYNFN